MTRSRRIAITAVVAGVVLTTGAILALPASAVTTAPRRLTDQLANCQDIAKVAKTRDERAWAQMCVNLATRAIDAAAPTPTPSSGTSGPTPTGRPTTVPTTAPPTTPPIKTPPLSGFPNAGNTGLPAGTVLAPVVRSLVITKPGTYSGLHVTGDVDIQSSNVTLTASRVECVGQCVHVGGNLTGVVVSHNDLGPASGHGNDPQGVNTFGSGPASSVIVEYNNIHNVGDGLRINGATTVQYNYVHDLDTVGSGAHSDGIQSEQNPNVVIRHNTIEGGNTSVILVQGDSENNWTIDGNLLLGVPDPTVNPPRPITSFIIEFDRGACPARNCVLSNNVINRGTVGGEVLYAESGPYGPSQWFGNTYQDNAATVSLP